MLGNHARPIVLALSAAFVASAAEAAPLIRGLGGPADFGMNCMGPNDDGYSGPVDLRPVFGVAGIRFFTEDHVQMYVNTNGNVSFSNPVPTFTPGAFPVANRPMIAPYWADVDIRTSTQCPGPGGGTGAAGACQNPADNGVWWHVDTMNRRVIVTWDEVGYYNCKTDKRMSFQLILTAVDTLSCAESFGSDFDVEFRFETCAWNAGDASGGNAGLATPTMCEPILPPLFYGCPLNLIGGSLACDASLMCQGVAAQAGFDAGNSTDFVEIMGSRTNAIHTTLCTDSNVAEAGVWRFQLRQGVVLCPDAGDVCDTGMMGACAEGQTQCVAGGTECVPLVSQSDEVCDAVDNDCNGMVDDGDLCGELETCERGVCIGVCFEGGCPSGQVCTEAQRCVDEGCESIECDDGERCVGGECAGACEGVVCPYGQSCRAGRCVDACESLTCDDCTACSEGSCITRCSLEPCSAGETCLESGLCVETTCVDVMCADGTHCVAGGCVDDCEGATCPPGQMCEAGECVPRPMEMMPMPDAGDAVDAGGAVDSGPPPTGDDAGPVTPDASPPDAAVDASAPRGRGAEPGCACHVPGSEPSLPSLLGLLPILALAVRRRR